MAYMGLDKGGCATGPASYPVVSLSMKMCAQRKAGRRQQTSPAVCTLSMVPCGSSPVARLYLAKNEASEEEAADGQGKVLFSLS